MIIYLRHADDNQHHSKHKHDNHISKKGKLDAKEIVYKLIEQYGYPNKIYYSPFLRCRETVTIMMNELLNVRTGYNNDFCLKCTPENEYIHIVELICDLTLSRYFTKKDRKRPSISASTLKYGVPIYEKKEGLSKRLDLHIESIRKVDSNSIIWCITHAVTYKKIAEKLNIKTPDHIEFLEYYSYTPNND